MEKEAKKCHKCGQFGHLGNKCSNKVKKMKCHLCGKSGHLRNECKGIEDDGSGQSKYKGKSSISLTTNKKKTNKKRERFIIDLFDFILSFFFTLISLISFFCLFVY